MNWLTSRITPVALLASLALVACDKGTDLSVDLPNTDPISTNYLALPVSAGTVQLKPVESLKADRYLIGQLTENVAGTTSARSYFNLLMTMTPDSLPVKFGAPILDSVVVVMAYDRVYGSSTTPARLNLYGLASKLDDREIYNSESAGPAATVLSTGTNVSVQINRTRQVTSTPSSTSPAVTTSVPDAGMRVVLHRRGNPALNSSEFTAIFEAMKRPGFTQATLDGLLKGLAIGPADGYSGALLSFNRSNVPRIEVYFHEDGAPARKWHAYPIAFGPVASSRGGSTASDPRYYTRIETNLAAGEKLRALSGTTPLAATATDNLTYLQEGVGLGTVIDLKSIAQLEALRGIRGLAINRAELRVPLKPYTNALFSNPNGIFALEAVQANNGGPIQVLERTANFVPIDRAVQTDGANPRGTSSEAYSGPAINSTGVAPYYSLPITNYLQAYLNNDLDGPLPTSLVLVPNVRRSLIRESTLGLNRAVVDANEIKLYIYYSKQ